MTTVNDVVSQLGSLLVHEVHGDPSRDRTVGGVVLWPDGADEPVAADDVVLLVGSVDDATLVARVQHAASVDAAAVFVRHDGALPADVLAAAGARLVVVTLVADMGWTHVVRLVTSAVEGHDRGRPGDDLSDVANAVATVIGAPVTIEDPQYRVLAFSDAQDDVDAARMAAIVGRRGPDDAVERMRAAGVLARVQTSTDPVVVAGRPPAILPRVVVPVRAGQVFLGSIWAIAKDPEALVARTDELQLAARTVALHLLRRRLETDTRRSHELRVVADLLGGSSAATDVALTEGFANGRLWVLAGAPLHAPDDVDQVLTRVWDGMRLVLGSRYRHSVTARVRDRIYSVVELSRELEDLTPASLQREAHRAAKEVADFVQLPVVLGAGSIARDPITLQHTRGEADRVVDVLLARGEVAGATVAEVGVEVLERLVVDAMARDSSTGIVPFAALYNHDQTEGTAFLPTVVAWIRSFGDMEAAATVLDVHANTVRYRMRQLRELALVDVDDHGTRRAVDLHSLRIELTR